MLTFLLSVRLEHDASGVCTVSCSSITISSSLGLLPLCQHSSLGLDVFFLSQLLVFVNKLTQPTRFSICSHVSAHAA